MTLQQHQALRASLQQRGFYSLEAYRDSLCAQYGLSEDTAAFYFSCCTTPEDVLTWIHEVMQEHSINWKAKEKTNE